MPNPVDAYAESVIAGEVVVGQYVRWACERHLRDRSEGSRRGLRFDYSIAEQGVIRVAQAMHHYKGPFARRPCTCAEDPESCERRLRLLPWQLFGLGSIFGWLRYRREVDQWVRRFTESLWLVARGQGKSHIASAVGVYMLRFDGEPAAEVYAAATNQDQSREVHDICKGLIRATPALQSRLMGWDKKLSNIYTEDGGKYEPVSRESRSLDGKSPYCVICDEMHGYRNADVRETLKTGMGKRRAPVEGIVPGSPLLFQISTAGAEFEGSICKALRDDAITVLEESAAGDPVDDSLFALIYEPDEGDDWRTSDDYLRKSNPSLGVAISLEELQEEREKAKRNPFLENDFRTKRGNEWTEQRVRLIPMDEWEKCPSELDLDALRGRRCYGGIDLATSEDFNAFSLVFPPNRPDGEWAVRCWYWIPENMIRRTEREKSFIGAWVRAGWVELSGGSVRNDDMIRDRILEQRELYDIVEIGFDRHSAADLMRKLEISNLSVVQVAQTFLGLSEATKRLLSLILSGKLNHGGNPVLRWNARNCEGQWDGKENVQPKKTSRVNRIDGIAATLNALERFIAQAPAPAQSVYSQRGPVVTA